MDNVSSNSQINNIVFLCSVIFWYLDLKKNESAFYQINYFVSSELWKFRYFSLATNKIWESIPLWLLYEGPKIEPQINERILIKLVMSNYFSKSPWPTKSKYMKNWKEGHKESLNHNIFSLILGSLSRSYNGLLNLCFLWLESNLFGSCQKIS